MSFYREQPVKKTRKNHMCAGCRHIIPAGSTATYVAYTDNDGEFGTYYLCDLCRDYLYRNLDMFREDGWREGELGEGRAEEAMDRKAI